MRNVFAANQCRYIPAIGGIPELHSQRTISEWAHHVALNRKTGCDGLIVYRMGGLDPAVAAFFGNGPFYGEAAFPTAMKKD